jgi:Spy/CpxP family protein refolding chaperone
MKRYGRVIRWGAGLAFAAATTLLAQTGDGRPGHGPGGPGWGRCRGLVESLALTAEQKTSLDALNQEMMTNMRPMIGQMRALHEQIETAAATTNPDACAIGALSVQEHGLHTQMDAVRKTAETKFVGTLSADQKAAYDKFTSVNTTCTAVGGMRPPPPAE